MLRTLTVLALAATVGCTASEPEDALAPRKREVLLALTDAVLLPQLQDVRDRAVELETATAAYAGEVTEPNRSAARSAWRATMVAWQSVEAALIGPGAAAGSGPGGEDLGLEIHSWPETNRCRMDQETVAESFRSVEQLRSEDMNVRGLDALEVLLFVEDTANACPPQDPINAEGTWDAIGPEGVRARRAAYAATLAVLVRERAEAILAGWAGADGFRAELAEAGLGSLLFPTAQLAVSNLAGSLFYLESEVLDMKIGDPSGLRMASRPRCEAPPCPDDLESSIAAHSRDNVAANLAGARAVVVGAPVGLDDLLDDLGAGSTAADLTSALDDAAAAVEAVEPSLEAALTDDPETVEAAFAALQAVVVILETDFAAALDFSPPAPPVGDND
ncbi:MAG: imelysin family protein [Sandaracinaceae bacterium]